MTAIKIFTSTIRADEGTQSRTEIDEEVVADYVEALSNGAAFPPVTVFSDGEDYWLADGFHRFQAHVNLKRESIFAEIQNGDRRAALLYACGANAEHGLQRTNADKRRAVEILLADEEWKDWSDREIANRCRVSPSFVGKIRSLSTDYSEESPRKYTDRYGNESMMKTSSIGATRQMSDQHLERKRAQEATQKEHDEAYALTPEEIERMHLDTVAQNDELRAQVAQLSASDLGAEVAKERAARLAAERAQGEAMDAARMFQRQLEKFGKWFAELRKLTRCDSNGQAMKVIRQELRRRNDAPNCHGPTARRMSLSGVEESANDEASETAAHAATWSEVTEERSDQERELRELVNLVLFDASVEDREEAFDRGRRDMNAALESFRALACDMPASREPVASSHDAEAA